MKKRMVMLVDDDPMSVTYSTLVIKKQNPIFDVLAIYNGYDALKYLKDDTNLKPEVIFLDINMPGMDGWEFLEEYEKTDLKIDIVLVTSSNDENDRNKSMSYKCITEFFTKPVTLDDVQRFFLTRD